VQTLAQSTVGVAQLSVPWLRWTLTGWHRPAEPMPEPRGPTSEVCVAAHQLCRDHSPEFMVHHCVRTYSFARLLGEHWGIAFDDEVLWISGMLHDIALMDSWEDRRPDEGCFTMPSGRAARRLCEQAGWSEDRVYRAQAAVTLNPSAEVAPELGIEARLLNLGVMVDAAGLRLWELHPDDVSRLLERAPRMGMKRKIVGFIHTEADAHPGCRFHFFRRYLRFADMARFAPFES